MFAVYFLFADLAHFLPDVELDTLRHVGFLVQVYHRGLQCRLGHAARERGGRALRERVAAVGVVDGRVRTLQGSTTPEKRVPFDV